MSGEAYILSPLSQELWAQYSAPSCQAAPSQASCGVVCSMGEQCDMFTWSQGDSCCTLGQYRQLCDDTRGDTGTGPSSVEVFIKKETLASVSG